MTFKRPYSAGLAALAAGLFAATAAYAEPTVNKGDNAWMLTSTVLVLLMTIPGLALFYGGLVRSKNMLSVLMQVFYTVCIVTVLWALYGYSLAFTGGSDFIGGFSKAFLMGVTTDSKAATFSVDANISELIYICFQMTFAAITPALIVGAFAERMKFAAIALFIPLWVTLIYLPIAHMVWFWPGPDLITDAAKAVAAAAIHSGRSNTRAACVRAAIIIPFQSASTLSSQLGRIREPRRASSLSRICASAFSSLGERRMGLARRLRMLWPSQLPASVMS